MSDSWLWMTGAALGRGIEAGEIDPRELTEVYLDAIETQPDAAAIYARLTPVRARAEADAARERARMGLRRGPLDGVPVSWKDLFDTAGTATEAGSALLRGRMPDEDAVVLKRAARAGLVALGKTHMSELAFSGLGVNPVTATPPNINDPDLAPGGSSSGAAASVAFGLAAAGIGSDTGGSIRVPAAWNDLVGFKPTAGFLPLAGTVPLCRRLDVPGPICRSVEDAALLMGVLGAEAPVDLAGATLEGRRFLVLEDVEGIGPTVPAVAEAFEDALDRLGAGGARIERGAVREVAEALTLSVPVYTVEAYGEWGEVIEANPDVMFHQILRRFRTGTKFGGPEYVRIWQRIDTLRAAFRRAITGYDAVLMPTTPNLPPNVDRLLADEDYYAEENMLTLRNTRIGNMLALCGISLPTGTPSVGIMAMGQGRADRALLRLGAAMERALETG
ncbi:MAG TPA: amidase family protein [Paracoccaceae bacterium]|nr:amidase family protein [Paracoccaceae bacterium]